MVMVCCFCCVGMIVVVVIDDENVVIDLRIVFFGIENVVLVEYKCFCVGFDGDVNRLL